MRNTKMFSEIDLKKLSDWDKERVKQAEESAAQISLYYPVEARHEFSKPDSYEYSRVVAQYCLIDVEVIVYKGKYEFICSTLKELTNTTHHTITEIQKSLPTPNKIGVLTEKKIKQWLEYWYEVYKKALATNNKNKAKEETFREQLKIREQNGYKIQWRFDNNKAGTIIFGGLVYEFTIHPTYINERISIHYATDSTLESFCSLADNKYTGKKKNLD
jgi:hypothetical protein